MKNTILLLLSTLTILFAFSSCDETELIDPVDQRTSFNLGAGDGTIDNNGVSSSVDGEEANGVRTSVGESSLFNIDPMDAEGVRTITGNEVNLANQAIDETDNVRSNYADDNDQALTNNPTDAAANRSSYGYTDPNWGDRVAKERNRDVSRTGSTGVDDRTPVMPEDVEARTRKSSTSSMQ